MAEKGIYFYTIKKERQKMKTDSALKEVSYIITIILVYI